MISAVLFDLGGTLDGDGLHWLDRFANAYDHAGVALERSSLRAAFDAAEARAAVDDRLAAANLDEMVRCHVAWQLEYLGRPNTVAPAIADRFLAATRAAAAASRHLLSALADRGFALGVVSNGCGNVEGLCREFGFAPYLKVIVDSHRAGVRKPDPAIFQIAQAQIGVGAGDTLVVGDSFDRDVAPARRAGMMTAWLQPDRSALAPDPSLMDFRLARLSDLLAVLEAPARA